MFSKQITNSDAFLDMPVSSQLLYFHFNMEADDDGFVSNPKRIMKMLSVSEDDLKILLAKRFLLPFESGVVVIKHWLLHNAVRKDMYKETQYIDEKKQLRIKENGVYTDDRNESVTGSVHRLDQIRLGKDRKEKEVFGEFKNVFLTQEERGKLMSSLGSERTFELVEELSSYMASKGKRYSSHYATILNWSRRKAKEGNKNKVGMI